MTRKVSVYLHATFHIQDRCGPWEDTHADRTQQTYYVSFPQDGKLIFKRLQTVKQKINRF